MTESAPKVQNANGTGGGVPPSTSKKAFTSRNLNSALQAFASKSEQQQQQQRTAATAISRLTPLKPACLTTAASSSLPSTVDADHKPVHTSSSSSAAVSPAAPKLTSLSSGSSSGLTTPVSADQSHTKDEKTSGNTSAITSGDAPPTKATTTAMSSSPPMRPNGNTESPSDNTIPPPNDGSSRSTQSGTGTRGPAPNAWAARRQAAQQHQQQGPAPQRAEDSWGPSNGSNRWDRDRGDGGQPDDHRQEPQDGRGGRWQDQGFRRHDDGGRERGGWGSRDHSFTGGHWGGADRGGDRRYSSWRDRGPPESHRGFSRQHDDRSISGHPPSRYGARGDEERDREWRGASGGGHGGSWGRDDQTAPDVRHQERRPLVAGGAPERSRGDREEYHRPNNQNHDDALPVPPPPAPIGRSATDGWGESTGTAAIVIAAHQAEDAAVAAATAPHPPPHPTPTTPKLSPTMGKVQILQNPSHMAPAKPNRSPSTSSADTPTEPQSPGEAETHTHHHHHPQQQPEALPHQPVQRQEAVAESSETAQGPSVQQKQEILKKDAKVISAPVEQPKPEGEATVVRPAVDDGEGDQKQSRIYRRVADAAGDRGHDVLPRKPAEHDQQQQQAQPAAVQQNDRQRPQPQRSFSQQQQQYQQPHQQHDRPSHRTFDKFTRKDQTFSSRFTAGPHTTDVDHRNVSTNATSSHTFVPAHIYRERSMTAEEREAHEKEIEEKRAARRKERATRAPRTKGVLWTKDAEGKYVLVGGKERDMQAGGRERDGEKKYGNRGQRPVQREGVGEQGHQRRRHEDGDDRVKKPVKKWVPAKGEKDKGKEDLHDSRTEKQEKREQRPQKEKDANGKGNNHRSGDREKPKTQGGDKDREKQTQRHEKPSKEAGERGAATNKTGNVTKSANPRKNGDASFVQASLKSILGGKAGK